MKRVEHIARSVIADFELPADLVSVAEAARGWRLVLRTRSNRTVGVEVFVAEHGPIRSAITRALAHA
jgi:hypothetical protein